MLPGLFARLGAVGIPGQLALARVRRPPMPKPLPTMPRRSDWRPLLAPNPRGHLLGILGRARPRTPQPNTPAMAPQAAVGAGAGVGELAVARALRPQQSTHPNSPSCKHRWTTAFRRLDSKWLQRRETLRACRAHVLLGKVTAHARQWHCGGEVCGGCASFLDCQGTTPTARIAMTCERPTHIRLQILFHDPCCIDANMCKHTVQGMTHVFVNSPLNQTRVPDSTRVGGRMCPDICAERSVGSPRATPGVCLAPLVSQQPR